MGQGRRLPTTNHVFTGREFPIIIIFKCQIKFSENLDFPGGPVVRTVHFHFRRHGFDPWLGS